MYSSLKVLGPTKSRREISLQLMLKILKTGLYSLYLVRLIYISIIYTLIYLYLINIRLLIRFNAIKLLLRILTIIYILLLTGCIAALICLGSIYLWVCLIALTFGPNISSRREVAATYIAFYEVQQPQSQIHQLIN